MGRPATTRPITPEEHRLQIVPTGQTADAAVVDETIDAAPGQAYLLAVFGLLNEIGGAIYDVDLSEIEPGNARVRLINFSPDAGDVDLLETGGDEWFGNVDARRRLGLPRHRAGNLQRRRARRGRPRAADRQPS